MECVVSQILYQGRKGIDLRELRENIRGRVDQIQLFLLETEPPKIVIPDFSSFYPVISVAVTGKLQEEELREITHQVRDDILEIDGIAKRALKVIGVTKYQLRQKYQNLSLSI